LEKKQIGAKKLAHTGHQQTNQEACTQTARSMLGTVSPQVLEEQEDHSLPPDLPEPFHEDIF